MLQTKCTCQHVGGDLKNILTCGVSCRHLMIITLALILNSKGCTTQFRLGKSCDSMYDTCCEGSCIAPDADPIGVCGVSSCQMFVLIRVLTSIRACNPNEIRLSRGKRACGVYGSFTSVVERILLL